MVLYATGMCENSINVSRKVPNNLGKAGNEIGKEK
jgi:hypothetical protein